MIFEYARICNIKKARVEYTRIIEIEKYDIISWKT